MSYPASAYVKLLIQRNAVGGDAWLKCLRETAEFYGWLDAYPLWTPPVYVDPHSGRRWVQDSNAVGGHFGGKRLKICRSATRHSTPRGKTNVFRISSRVTKDQLAELAALTKVPFGWMQDKAFRRLSYDDWMALATVGVPLAAKRRALAS
jgi:hypothetical protein